MSTPLPAIGKPATRALQNIGVSYLEDLRLYDLENLQKLHGIGPKASQLLEEALEEVGWTFKASETLPFKPKFAVFGDLKCNNAPKKEIIRNFHIAERMVDEQYLTQILSDDLVVEFVPKQPLNSLGEFLTFLKANIVDLSSLHLKSLQTHGKIGASEVIAVNKQGSKNHYAYFFDFASHKKDSLIRKINIYAV